MMSILLRILITLTVVEYCSSARILGMFPAPLLSHQMVFKALTHELAKRGHQVTVVTCYSVTEKKVANYTEINLSYLGKETRKKLSTKKLNKATDLHDQFEVTLEIAFDLIHRMLKTEEMLNLIKHNTFDLILIEDCTKDALILSHLLKAPVIFISSFGGSFDTFETIGGVVHPILYPLAIKKRYQNLSTWEKISEIYHEYKLQKFYNKLILKHDDINKVYYGADTPTIRDLKSNVQMTFLNIHSLWDSNRPVPPNVIYLGGLHRMTPNELPKDLKSSLDSSVNGAIYVSFGSTTDLSTFSSHISQIFINVFSKLPYDIYWRWSDIEISELPKNVKISNWYPQSDLLQHPNIKLFITQGGLQSTDEAIAAGVPLIGLPLLWDQWFNVDKYDQLKIGRQLNFETLTEDVLSNAIETVMGDKEYYTNILQLRSIMTDSPQTSLERAVWWTEYVLRHGAAHLRSPSANISWIDYYENKFILLLFSMLMTALRLILITLTITFILIIAKYRYGKDKTL